MRSLRQSDRFPRDHLDAVDKAWLLCRLILTHAERQQTAPDELLSPAAVRNRIKTIAATIERLTPSVRRLPSLEHESHLTLLMIDPAEMQVLFPIVFQRSIFRAIAPFKAAAFCLGLLGFLALERPATFSDNQKKRAVATFLELLAATASSDVIDPYVSEARPLQALQSTFEPPLRDDHALIGTLGEVREAITLALLEYGRPAHTPTGSLHTLSDITDPSKENATQAMADLRQPALAAILVFANQQLRSV